MPINRTPASLLVLAATAAVSLPISLVAGVQQVGHADYKMGGNYGPVVVKAFGAKEVTPPTRWLSPSITNGMEIASVWPSPLIL